jgi:hypothetical protein
MRLGVPFIAPRQLGAVEDHLGRQTLPSVEWCTGQSGAPPDNYCSCPVLDFFPYGEQPTAGPRDRLAHRTLSGAHRTVQCAQPIVGATMCRAKIAWPTVGAGDRWLTGQSGAPPDSPVNFSRTSLILFPRAAISPETSLAHRTLSGAPPDSPVCQTELKFGCTQPRLLQFDSLLLSTVSSSWITMLVHKTIHQV